MENAEIAAQLEAFAALLELNDASYYTARAYRRAAELIRDTPAPVAELVEQGRAHGSGSSWRRASSRSYGSCGRR